MASESNRSPRSKRGRFFVACGVLMASVFLVLELPRQDKLDSHHVVDVLELNNLDQIRVLMRRHGASPWHLKSESTLTFRGDTKTELRSKDCLIKSTQNGISVNGELLGHTVSMTECQDFELNNKPLRGRLKLTAKDNSTNLVLCLDLERYLAQVLPGEMPLSYPDAALEAQVIASRSYALARMIRRKGRQWDLTDGESSQMFRSMDGQTDKALAIVARTRGIVLRFDNKILPAYFSANCGGHTRSNHEAFGENPLPPLCGVRCQSCAWSKDYSWMARLSIDDFKVSARLSTKAIESLKIEKGPGSGYTNKIRCRVGGSSKLISPSRLRKRLGNRKIKSDWVTGIELGREQIRIGGRGFGHGVGLCQNGACGLARIGKSASYILAHYYPTATLARIREPSNP